MNGHVSPLSISCSRSGSESKTMKIHSELRHPQKKVVLTFKKVKPVFKIVSTTFFRTVRNTGKTMLDRCRVSIPARKAGEGPVKDCEGWSFTLKPA